MIMKLNELEYALFKTTAESDSPCFLVNYPPDDAPAKDIKESNKKLNRMKKLMKLGLLKDVSSDFTVLITNLKLRTGGKKFSVFAITPMAQIMFKDIETRPLN